MQYSNGSMYEGEFVAGVANGFGKFVSGQGDEYEGFWSND